MKICQRGMIYRKMAHLPPLIVIEVSPNFTNRDRLIDSALGSLNIAIIPIVLSISMICCVTFFYKKKLSKPIKLLTNAYHKIEANDLDFTISYQLYD